MAEHRQHSNTSRLFFAPASNAHELTFSLIIQQQSHVGHLINLSLPILWTMVSLLLTPLPAYSLWICCS